MSLEKMLMGPAGDELELHAVDLDDDRDMADVFDEVAMLPCSCFLDSSLRMPGYGEHSFIGFDPYLVLTTRGTAASFRSRAGEILEVENLDPFEALRMAMRARRASRTGDAGLPPFIGGGIGYLSYELGRYVEQLPESVVDDLQLPELAFAFFDHIVAADLETGRKQLLLCADPGADIASEVEMVKARIAPGAGGARASDETGAPPQADGGGPLLFECGFTKDEYLNSVGRVKDYILAGDIYQANLSQRFSAPLVEPAWDLYRRLRVVNAAPFSAYLNFGEFAVASSSPERFLLVNGSRVETRPIKGTSRRYAEAERDERSRNDLMQSKKDRAELSMIVDLERNDLGRVCRYGSVRVEEHAVLESYATVHHLVSTVTGDLHPDRDMIDLLRATFPGGSITGAPKIRSIEIIDELEPTARSVYTGAIGYLGMDGRHDLNIAIRTMIIRGGKVYFQVGGGIVADSGADSEFQETLDKGKAMFDAVTGATRNA
ncbi:MAG: aminodeoxychorismate synthase component I [Candidatus Geothermincolia bacterium]